MKSIILIVLLALAKKSMGDARNEFESSQLGNFQIFQQNGGKPILVKRDSSDDPELSSDASDSDDTAVEEQQDEEHSRHYHTDKVDCNCNKNKPKITYGPEQIVKGKPETYIHHQPKIIVRQPPTHVRIEHPPTVIQPATIVLRRQGKILRRPVIYQHLPQDVRVRPVIVKVVKPIEKKVLVENKSDSYAKVSQPCKVHHDHSNDEYETETYGGETYSESFNERESYNQHESLRGHLKIKETTPLY